MIATFFVVLGRSARADRLGERCVAGLTSISKNATSGPGSSWMNSGRTSLKTSFLRCRSPAGSRRTRRSRRSPMRNANPSPLRIANSFATCRLVTRMFSWTSHPVPTHSYALPVSSMRPTARIASSQERLRGSSRAFQIVESPRSGTRARRRSRGLRAPDAACASRCFRARVASRRRHRSSPFRARRRARPPPGSPPRAACLRFERER